DEILQVAVDMGCLELGFGFVVRVVTAHSVHRTTPGLNLKYTVLTGGSLKPMPVLGRTKKDILSEFRRTELLTAARAIFGKKGFHEASIDEIAEMAEVAKGTVYLYYKSKKDLYMEALKFGVESLNKELKARAGQGGDCLATLRVLT